MYARLTKATYPVVAGMLLTMGLAACSDTSSTSDKVSVLADAEGTRPSEEVAETSDRPAGWSEDTHSNDVDPNYDVVFPQDRVNQITITIAPEDWEAMQTNMVDLFGESGAGGQDSFRPDGFGAPDGEGNRQPLGDEGFPGGAGPHPGDWPQPGEEGFPDGFDPQQGDRPRPGEGGLLDGFEPPADLDGPMPPEGAQPGNRPGGGGFGGGGLTPENPTWVPATVEFEGKLWTTVGVRYKGNSSLTSGWRSGTLKLPLKLDFDEFEDDYPEIDDQRFYGFKQLSLANGFHDASFLRDAATSDILQEAGLPAAETAFYQVTLDYGEGPVTLGLYTVIEVVDDTAVERTFGSDDGNIYEGEGTAASFAASAYNQIELSFQKENNEDQSGWSDIEELFDVLHSDQRTSDPVSWRANLESVFDVDAFLEWLAISAAIQNWDAYGAMSHNYYLYHDPDSGLLTWISWDHNEAMSTGTGGGGRGALGSRNVSLDKADVGDNWPLIRYLLDDPVFHARYVDYLGETVAGPFNPDRMAETYQTLAALIAPYAAADVGETEFEAAVQQLIEHAYGRADAVEAFLATQSTVNIE
jgi:spore coat protein H